MPFYCMWERTAVYFAWMSAYCTHEISPELPVHSRTIPKFPIWNISKTPLLDFLWWVMGNIRETDWKPFRPFQASSHFLLWSQSVWTWVPCFPQIPRQLRAPTWAPRATWRRAACAPSVGTEPRGSTTVHPAATAAKASFDAVSAKTTCTRAGGIPRGKNTCWVSFVT